MPGTKYSTKLNLLVHLWHSNHCYQVIRLLLKISRPNYSQTKYCVIMKSLKTFQSESVCFRAMDEKHCYRKNNFEFWFGQWNQQFIWNDIKSDANRLLSGAFYKLKNIGGIQEIWMFSVSYIRPQLFSCCGTMILALVTWSNLSYLNSRLFLF